MAKPNITGLWIEHVALKHDSDDCLMWPFSKIRDGYGRFRHEGKKVLAHRYILHRVSDVDLSTPLEAMHSCHTPGCTNPRHLSWGTHTENMHDKLDNGTYGSNLTPEQALAIYNAEGFHYEIAKKFGVRQAQVSRIKTGKTWSEVTGQKYILSSPRLSKEIILGVYFAEGPQCKIAKMFGVSPQHVSDIKSGKRWAEVTKHVASPRKPRLTEETVLKIYNAEGVQREIAKMFGVSNMLVSNIKLGKNWSKITGHLREPTEN